MPQFGLDLAEVIMHQGIVGIALYHLLKRFERLFIFLPLDVVDEAEDVVGAQVIRIFSQGALEGYSGAVVLAETVVGNADIGMGIGVVGGQFDGALESLASPGVIVLIHINHALVVVPARLQLLCRRGLILFLGRCAGREEPN